ncbi:MAG: fumarylacetoacetate hydrolase family protein [Planctomycetes bacterium]|nr:fumarylacetoacetate hydrolase family protein [Planctomycetota bacterium]
MRYCTFQLGRRTAAGFVGGEFVYDLGQAFFRTFKRPFAFRDLLDFLEVDGPDRIGEIDFGGLKSDRTVCAPMHSVLLRAPLPRPPKIVCVGLNYRDHAREQDVEPPENPLLFAKAPNVVIGPEEAIEIPAGISECVDPEVELGVVIGRPGDRIAREDAWSHVFGFTVFNDVTARDVQKSDRQFFRGKSFRTFAPMGPWIVTPDELNVRSLALRLAVNGEQRQKGNTSDMIFDVPRLIEYASACFPLEAGDVIATGTPAGVGAHRDPPVYLKAGDVVEASIEGIGTLTNGVR